MKLIRDKMADTPSPNGRLVLIAPAEQYRNLLLQKLLEEANEVAVSKDIESMTVELADLREVLDCLVREFGISEAAVSAAQTAKRHERGSFERRVCIL